MPLVSLLCGALLALVGCSAPRVNNTRLIADDLIAMTDQMAESITADADFGAKRDEPWIITIDRVINHTNDIIPEGEQRAYLARLRALLNLAKVPHVQFVREAELSGPNRLLPTHAITAEFYAITRADRSARSDFYLCAFSLQDLKTDKLIWEDRYEVKRQVIRSKMD